CCTHTSPRPTFSLHDALPISLGPETRTMPTPPRPGGVAAATMVSLRVIWAVRQGYRRTPAQWKRRTRARRGPRGAHECAASIARSEEHTSELQSLAYLVCRLL